MPGPSSCSPRRRQLSAVLGVRIENKWQLYNQKQEDSLEDVFKINLLELVSLLLSKNVSRTARRVASAGHPRQFRQCICRHRRQTGPGVRCMATDPNSSKASSTQAKEDTQQGAKEDEKQEADEDLWEVFNAGREQGKVMGQEMRKRFDSPGDNPLETNRPSPHGSRTRHRIQFCTPRVHPF
eukprot:1185478-Prorocentrum_minimum.AAC.1